MKKVLFVIDSLTCGGAEKSLVTLLSLFDYRKYSVDLLLFKRNGSFEKYLPNKINLIDPPGYMIFIQQPLKGAFTINKLRYSMTRFNNSINLRMNKNSGNKLHTAQVIWKSIKSCIEPLNQKYDVAIAYSQGLPTYYVAEKVSSDKKIAWINTDYNTAGYYKEYDFNFYKTFSNIVAVSDKLKGIMENTFPELRYKITTVYDIVDPQFLYNMADSGDGFTDNFDGLRIFTIGRIVPYKGYDIAVETCEKLKNDGYKIKWYAAGDGTSRKEIEDLIEHKNLKKVFILLGEQDNPYQYLRQTDIYVQTSKFEGFGLTIAEARIFKKPIVSTNFSVIHDQIKNENNGLIVEMNSDAVYKGIKRLIEDVNLRNRFIKNLSSQPPYSTVSEIERVYGMIEN